MRPLVLALAVFSAGCLDLDHLLHLHDLGEDAGVDDLSGVDQAAGSFTWSAPVAGLAGTANTVRVAPDGKRYLATEFGGIWAFDPSVQSPSGPSWTWLSATLSQHDINDVAITPNAIYAASHSGGMWRSSDGGVTWASLVDSPTANVLAVSTSGTVDTVYAGTSVGVSISQDSGATWAALEDAGADMSVSGPTAVHALALSSANDLYAGGSNGVFVYANGDWAQASTSSGGPRQVVTIAFAGDNLYLGTSQTSATATTGSLFKGTRTGGTGPFSFVPVVLNPVAAGIQAVAYDGTTVFASSLGVARYAIDASAGTVTPTKTANDLAINGMAVAADGTLCAAGGFGFANATTAAPALTTNTPGLHNTNITTITDDTASTGILFAGSSTGQVVRTLTAGATWATEDSGLDGVGAINVLATGPLTYARAYAGALTGLFATTSTGSTWSAVGTAGAPPSAPVTAFASDPVAENTIYAASPDGVHKSTDGGTSWALLAGSPKSATAILVTTHALYIAGSSSLGDGGIALPTLVRSTDAGTTFETADDGLPGIPVSQLLGTGATTDTVYAATPSDGIYRTTDGGMTWQPANSGLGNTTVRGIAFNPNTPLLMYAGTQAGVYASTDGGTVWTNVTKNLGNTDVRAIAVSGTVVLVGTNGDGVFLGQ